MPAISSSVALFTSALSFPASGSFPMSQFFASGGQSNGASVSTIPVPSCRLEGGCPEPVPHWTLSYLPELRMREGCGQKPKEFSLKKKKKKTLWNLELWVWEGGKEEQPPHWLLRTTWLLCSTNLSRQTCVYLAVKVLKRTPELPLWIVTSGGREHVIINGITWSTSEDPRNQFVKFWNKDELGSWISCYI